MADLDAVRLTWLGQAGFLIEGGATRVLIDPYLSDYLARKYRGKEFPHIRMMAPPLQAANLRGITLVLCTHAHSDHMDPESLPVIAANNPECFFVLPRAAMKTGLERGIPADRMHASNAGESLQFGAEIKISAIASAHEKIELDQAGNHRFLGYIAQFGGKTIYHSGDCVPYPGLAKTLRAFKIDAALLPVNGRDAYRQARGIAGNFTFDEAVALCRNAGIARLIAHHYGMFAFNTVDEKELRLRIAAGIEGVQCVLPELGKIFY